MGIRIITNNLWEMKNSRDALAVTKRRDEDSRFDSVVSEMRDQQNWNDKSMIGMYEAFIKEQGLCLEAALYLRGVMKQENGEEDEPKA